MKEARISKPIINIITATNIIITSSIVYNNHCYLLIITSHETICTLDSILYYKSQIFPLNFK